MTPTDAELVTRSRRHDAAAFGSLVERHQDLVFGIALARCGDPELASDLVQDAFVIAWRTLDRLRDLDRVGPWVAGIARNLASGATRARAREASIVPEAAVVPTPEDAALEREGRELVRRALAELPATHREVLVLHYFQGQSIAAIASGTGISQDLVKQRLSRGRRALREHVSRLLDDGRLRMRPRPGIVASVVAAVTVPTLEAAATTVAGKSLVMAAVNKPLVIVAGVLLALALAGGATWMIARSATPAASMPAAQVRDASPPRPQTSPQHSAPNVRRIDPAARAELLARIRDARSRAPALRTSGVASTSTTSPGLASGRTMEDYVLAALQKIMPLLKECYAEGHARIPDLAGKVVIDFTIEGEPEIGGLVGESAIAGAESTLADPAVLECIQETIYAIEIDPPERGVVHQMRTALELRPGDEPTTGIDYHQLRGTE